MRGTETRTLRISRRWPRQLGCPVPLLETRVAFSVECLVWIAVAFAILVEFLQKSIKSVSGIILKSEQLSMLTFLFDGQ